MSEEIVFEDPEITFSAILTNHKGKPALRLVKQILSVEKIKILAELILKEKYIPARITVKDKLRFSADLKAKKLI